MRLIVTNDHSDDVYALDVSPDMLLRDFRAYIEAESGISAESQLIYCKGNLLNDDTRSLSFWRLEFDDIILVRLKNPPPPILNTNNNNTNQINSTQVGNSAIISNNINTNSNNNPNNNNNNSNTNGITEPNTDNNIQSSVDFSQKYSPKLLNDIEHIRLQLIADPGLRAAVNAQNPNLVLSIHEPMVFRDKLIKLEEQRAKSEELKRQELKRLNDDPFNEEAQAKILEIIRQEAIMENLHTALEHNPEVFGQVGMLYVACEVNGHPIRAFVDSGAQATVMSPHCAEACNITHLIDKKYAGIAHGVGTAKILGRIHSAYIKLGTNYLACSFTVMEGRSVDLLIGLDMLKRHQACIDLKKNVLSFNDSEIPFLSEADAVAHEEKKKNLDYENTNNAHSKDNSNTNGQSNINNNSNLNSNTTTFEPTSISNSTSTTTTPAAASSSVTNNDTNMALANNSTNTPSVGNNIIENQLIDSQIEPSEEAISQIVTLGFSREEAVRALKQSGGNIDYAASSLFS